VFIWFILNSYHANFFQHTQRGSKSITLTSFDYQKETKARLTAHLSLASSKLTFSFFPELAATIASEYIFSAPSKVIPFTPTVTLKYLLACAQLSGGALKVRTKLALS